MSHNPVQLSEHGSISCVEMHTCGEPTRIVYAGYPDLQGTLLEQRAEAKTNHDHIRRRLNWEPRGHFDMYGAILRPNTELTSTGEAHMGVLFTTNEGYSTMCGHATIALGRFLVDYTDTSVFPQRSKLKLDSSTNTTLLKLHAPCGLLEVTVPTSVDNKSTTSFRSDPSRPVTFISVPSFSTGLQIRIPIPLDYQWLEIFDRDYVTVDFAYGGAFYCFVSAQEMGFPAGTPLNQLDLTRLDIASRNLKAAVNADSRLRKYFRHPEEERMGFLYSVFFTDTKLGKAVDESSDAAEAGLCFFADQQIDRSPTGSGVAARVALAVAKGEMDVGRGRRTYHSFVSLSMDEKRGGAGKGKGAFVGSVLEKLDVSSGDGYEFPVVKVKVEGSAYYTGFSRYVVEEEDPIGDDGFIFKDLAGIQSVVGSEQPV